MIASHGVLIGLTCLSKPKPSCKVQLITEVKCGTQSKPSAVSVLSSA